MTRSDVRILAEKALKIHKKIERLRPLYRELDQIVERLAKEKIIEVRVGRIQLQLVDNFAKKNTVFKATGIKRFELQIRPKKKAA